MFDGITLITRNLGFNYETIVLVIMLLGCSVFYAKDFKIGVIMTMVMSGGMFMYFYEWGFNYVPALTIFFISLVVLALSLYATKEEVTKGAVI